MLTITPQGRAVAAIVLAFTLLTGSLNRLVYAVIGIIGHSFPDGKEGIALFSFMAAVLSVAVLILARGAATADGWAGAVGQGAVVLVWVNLLLVVLALIGGLTNGDEGFSAAYFPGLFSSFGGSETFSG